MKRKTKKSLKNLLAISLVLSVALTLAACGRNQTGETVDSQPEDNTVSETTIAIKASPDKYTWYIKNYVGKNCASIGDTYGDEKRIDEYGRGEVELIMVADDGSFVDPTDKESLRNYVVTGQSVAPNTELKLVFEKYSDGEESDYSIESQNIEEIELYVKRITSQTSTD